MNIIKTVLLLFLVFCGINSFAQLTVTIHQTNATCGFSDGSAKVIVSGGSGYSYLWSTGATTDSIGGLVFGSYTVTVYGLVAGNIDSIIKTIQINSLGIDLSGVTISQPSCGNKDGQINGVNGNGGTLPYTFNWDSAGIPFSNAAPLINVYQGSYRLKIVDASSSCAFDTTFILRNAGLPNLVLSPSSPIICSGDSVTLTAQGIFNGSSTWTGSYFSFPVSGTSVKVGPASTTKFYYNWFNNNCVLRDSVTVTVTKVQAVLVNAAQPTCGKNNGDINCAVNGISPFNFTFLKNGVVAQTGSSSQIANQGPGTYTFIVTGSVTGCSDTIKNINLVDNSSSPYIDSFITTSIKCFGETNASATIKLKGGSGSYTYKWSQDPTNTSNVATGLTSGIKYTVTFTDGGCSILDTSFTILGPTSPLNFTFSKNDDNCNQGVGSAKATVDGGTAPYNFAWANGQSGIGLDSLNFLSAGTPVGVTVTDANGCFVGIADVTIGNTGSPSAIIQNSDSICNGAANGRLSVLPISNDGPYIFLWSSGDTSATAINLVENDYTVTVTNSKGCSVTVTGTVANFGGAYVDLGSTKTISLGEKVELEAKTGVNPKTVLWSPYVPNNGNSLLVYAQPTDTTLYKVQVFYGKNCKLEDSVLVNVIKDEPQLVMPNIFSPNGDGVNDFYYVSSHKLISDFHIWMYNRWGDKVFESTDVDFKWDGTNIFTNNQQMNTAVIAYVIEYHSTVSNQKVVLEGNVTLVK